MFALLLCLTLAADSKPESKPTPEADAKALQGRWTVASHESGGKKVDPKTTASWVLIVEGKEMTARDGLEILSAYTFQLSPRAVKGPDGPRAIDLVVTAGTDKDRKVAGIYKVEGGTFTVCVAEPDKERPRGFTTAEGSGQMLFVFQREKK